MIAVTAHMLGVIHRRIGVEHQLALIFAIVRIERNTDTEGHHHIIGINSKRAIDSADERTGDRRGIVRRGNLCQQHEFVATNARQRILPLQLLREPLGHRHQ